MPKVKTLKTKIGSTEFSTSLTVRSNGRFYAKSPDPEKFREFEADTALEVENMWHKASKEYAERKTTKRKVIIIEWDSVVRTGGKRCFFTNDDTTLMLYAAIAEETTIVVGEDITKSYREWPDYTGFRSPETPIPHGYRIRSVESGHRDRITIVEWSQQIEDMIVRACNGIDAVIEMLDEVFCDPNKITKTSLKGLPLLNHIGD